MGIICTEGHLVELAQGGKKVSLCHGVFDVLHEGHLRYLEEAKRVGDTLVVSVTGDKYVNKGPGRPYFNENIRATMVAALNIVDYVLISNHERATPVIQALRPDFYIKGPDYKNKEADVTGGIFEEEEAVRNVGGQMLFTSGDMYSSSTLINKFFHNFSKEQLEVISHVNALGGIAKIKEIFEHMSKLEVLVAGEPIVDTYIFCKPENISSKSPTISARYKNEENYAGGSWAVANHLADFCKVGLYAPTGLDVATARIKEKQIDRRIKWKDFSYQQVTTRKTRYIDQDTGQRMFELTHVQDEMIEHSESDLAAETLRHASKDADLTLLCDFGHGMFEGMFLDTCMELDGLVALNCQTNSSNFGFNPYSKHKNIDYLSIDLKEARVNFHDRRSDALTLFHKITGPDYVSMTLGASGAFYRDKETIRCPAFADKVVDAVGAGDAYYAITSLLVAVDAPKIMIPFIGNVFAGLKTKIIGNKESVSKAQTLKALEAILK